VYTSTPKQNIIHRTSTKPSTINNTTKATITITTTKTNDYDTAKYNPSIATFACHTPSFRIALRNAGAGKISANASGNSTSSDTDSSSVMLGLITRK
jgi:hypothetical protein